MKHQKLFSKICIIIVACLYLAVYLSLIFKQYNFLLIAPFVLAGWCLFITFIFLKDYKHFIKDLEAEEIVEPAYSVKEDRDFLYIIHTIAIIFWPIFWLGSIIIDYILR
ncbi:MAG: hypothetical protein NTX82_00765 [Candidatus Parcubacteria bacterium]|nr:hypothetical protein [Candidatus Parcubacteria bacterium]